MQSSNGRCLVKAVQCFNAGKLEKAASLCAKVIRNNPCQPDALNLAGVVALRRRRYQYAIHLFERALGVCPDNALYHFNRGLAYAGIQGLDAAIQSFREAVRLQPDLGPAWSDLCLALVKSGDLDGALEAAHVALRLEPNDARVCNNLALVHESTGNFELALKYYRQAVTLAPDEALFHKNLGNIYLGMGDTGAAERCYRKAIHLNPSLGESWLQLVNMRRYDTPHDEDVERIRVLLDNGMLADQDRADLHFALGKILDDCCLYERAFEQYSQANRLIDKQYDFKPDSIVNFVSGLLEFFDPESIRQAQDSDNLEAAPVFIVGMPRSGTSLVEQIVSSHPDVFGAGELRWFGEMERKLPGFLASTLGYPQCLESMTPAVARILSEKYLRYQRALAGSGYRLIVDKMPANFLRMGLIRMLFRNARFVYCRRNALDTGLSIFFQRFAGSIHWGYDLFNIGVYYAQHERLMRHWKSVFPDSILEVNYEDLVSNQEAVTRKLLDFLGLPWEQACLAFHRTRRCVFTASDVQVRQPMYTGSIERWKNYARFLSPLKEGLSSNSR